MKRLPKKILSIMFVMIAAIGCYSSDHLELKEINSIEELENINNGLILVTSENCDACNRLKNHLTHDSSLTEIELSELNISKLRKSHDFSVEEAKNVIDNYSLSYVPQIIWIENGELQSSYPNYDDFDESDFKNLENENEVNKNFSEFIRHHNN